MKKITLIETIQATHVISDISDDEVSFFESELQKIARTVEGIYKDAILSDDLRITNLQIFIHDKDYREEVANKGKQREIRELTERLLKLVSE